MASAWPGITAGASAKKPWSGESREKFSPPVSWPWRAVIHGEPTMCWRTSASIGCFSAR